ncbi:MAG TPA: tripartite tricarboxylate transporter permease [Atribacterota bacterium]|nr:tripartite tricarboxylate transporter permease [Atribacterota bacterium]
MSVISSLLTGLLAVFQINNLLFVVLGSFIGIVIGILPGLGSSAAIAMLIPLGFALPPNYTLIMMCAIYMGAMTAGAITSILLNVPGTPAAVMTALDGHPLALKGQAGKAIGIGVFSSFVGGTLSIIGLSFLSMPLVGIALKFGPPEYFSVFIVAFTIASTLIGKSALKGVLGVFLGIILSTVGSDLQTGVPRFTYGLNLLLDGIDFVVATIGIFAMGEVLSYIVNMKKLDKNILELKGKVWPTMIEFLSVIPSIIRGTIIGFIAGILPGSGGALGTAVSYAVEKRVHKDGEHFGEGILAGVAAPEAANNASVGGALIPMMTLGVPGSGTTAILMVVLFMYGLKPGPLLFIEQSTLVWTVISSLYVSNLAVLLIVFLMLPIFVKILKIQSEYLLPGIVLFSAVGVYTVHSLPADVYLLIFFGLLALALRQLGFSIVPVILGLLLGASVEQSFRQSMIMSRGSFEIFFTRPISLILLSLVIVIILTDIYRKRKQGKLVSN